MKNFRTGIESLSPQQGTGLENGILEKDSSTQNRPPGPLSFGQESLWLFDQLGSNRSAYNLPQAFGLCGPLRIEPLQRALEHIVQRHESLRTNFISGNDAPMQIVRENKKFILPVIDLSAFSDLERENEVHQRLEKEGQRPFDLAQDPMLRALLLKLGDDDHILFLCVHHIAADDWSLGLLHKELSALYENFCAEKSSPLPDLDFQYSEFALQQRQPSESIARQSAYWKERLAGELPMLALSTDRPRPAQPTFRGAREQFKFPPSLLSALKDLSRREKATIHAVSLAAFEILLQRYSRQDDILVGCPIGTRHRRDLENLIGFFINTVPLRGDLSGNPAFQIFLRQVNRDVLGALTNQEVFWERLIQDLKLPRQPGRNPLFQVVFQYLPMPVQCPHLSGLAVEFFPVNTNGSQFDLALTLRSDGDDLLGELEYSTDLFNRATVRRMLGHYQILLESIVANPMQKIARLPLLTEEEKHQLLFDWNSVETSPEKIIPIHRLIEEQAARVPNQIAVRCGEKTLSYAELNRRANQLARYLNKIGAAPETPIGLCCERSPEMILAILAILKSGAAYVPLDPNYPKERLKLMLAATRAPIILTHSKLLENLPAHDGKIICIDTDWESIAKEGSENLDRPVSSENLAYIIFTSGSTGQPKGVLITHGNLSHSVAARLAHYPQLVKNFLLTFSFAFDGSVAGIFWALTSGGALTLPEEGSHQDPAELARIIERTKVSHTICLPSVYSLILENAEPEDLASLETVVVAGETSGNEVVEKHAKMIPGASLFNEYGPTEGTIWSTMAMLHPNREGKVTIGKPIRNVQVYLLDAEQSLVPAGVPGEIFIGGAGVARGYLNHPELTAEKFIPDPFRQNSGARLYRTGDLARFLDDGKIEFLGRLDHQVKIRGYRIELGEIETVLRNHPAVRDAVVIVRQETSGEKSLVAYAAASPESALKKSELRAFLKAKLPEYMLPSAFVILDELPLHPNGKLNRKALPAPDFRAEEANFAAPRTPVERQVAQIWIELLKVEPIGVNDNFFDLGGHSLLATQVVSRTRSLHRRELTLREFFNAPTIAGLSALLENSDETKSALPSIVPLSRKTKTDSAHELAVKV